jgi:hypothetical protein
VVISQFARAAVVIHEGGERSSAEEARDRPQAEGRGGSMPADRLLPPDVSCSEAEVRRENLGRITRVVYRAAQLWADSERRVAERDGRVTVASGRASAAQAQSDRVWSCASVLTQLIQQHDRAAKSREEQRGIAQPKAPLSEQEEGLQTQWCESHEVVRECSILCELAQVARDFCEWRQALRSSDQARYEALQREMWRDPWCDVALSSLRQEGERAAAAGEVRAPAAQTVRDLLITAGAPSRVLTTNQHESVQTLTNLLDAPGCMEGGPACPLTPHVWEASVLRHQRKRAKYQAGLYATYREYDSPSDTDEDDHLPGWDQAPMDGHYGAPPRVNDKSCESSRPAARSTQLSIGGFSSAGGSADRQAMALPVQVGRHPPAPTIGTRPIAAAPAQAGATASQRGSAHPALVTQTPRPVQPPTAPAAPQAQAAPQLRQQVTPSSPTYSTPAMGGPGSDSEGSDAEAHKQD